MKHKNNYTKKNRFDNKVCTMPLLENKPYLKYSLLLKFFYKPNITFVSDYMGENPSSISISTSVSVRPRNQKYDFSTSQRTLL